MKYIYIYIFIKKNETQTYKDEIQRLNQKIKELECEINNLKSKVNILQRKLDHTDKIQRRYFYAKRNNHNEFQGREYQTFNYS